MQKAKLQWDDALTLGKQDAPKDASIEDLEELSALFDETPKQEQKSEAKVTSEELDKLLDDAFATATETVEVSVPNKPEEVKKESGISDSELDELLADMVSEETPKEEVKEESVTEEEPVVVEVVQTQEPEKPQQDETEKVQDEVQVEETKPEEKVEEVTEEPKTVEVPVVEPEEPAVEVVSEEPTVEEPAVEEPVEEAKEETATVKDETLCPACGNKTTELLCGRCGFRRGNKTFLERVTGETKYISPQKLIMKNPILCNENIVRPVDGGYELIGYAPIKVKIAQLSDDEADILQIDHAVKTQPLSDEDKANAYKYESEKIDVIKNLFGIESVAELNNISESEMAKILKKLPEKTQEILDKILKETDIKDIPDSVFDALANLNNPSERDVLMTLLKGIEKWK